MEGAGTCITPLIRKYNLHNLRPASPQGANDRNLPECSFMHIKDKSTGCTCISAWACCSSEGESSDGVGTEELLLRFSLGMMGGVGAAGEPLRAPPRLSLGTMGGVLDVGAVAEGPPRFNLGTMGGVVE
eukprot:1159321-Pelagomonas_calceolata.AAC.3